MFNILKNFLSCSFLHSSSMSVPVASNSNLLELPSGTWQIMQDSSIYGSDFGLVVNPSSVWWLEFKDGLPSFLLIIDVSPLSIAWANLLLALFQLYWHLKNLNSISDDTWIKTGYQLTLNLYSAAIKTVYEYKYDDLFLTKKKQESIYKTTVS